MIATLALIVAYDGRRAIGKDGAMPWHEPADLKHFKRTTMGHPIIMGRKTHASIGRALPGRRNLVLTRSQDTVLAPGCERFTSVAAALASARTDGAMPFVIGGASIYELTLPLATHLYLTEMEFVVEHADTFFPAVDERDFEEVARVADASGRMVFRTLERVHAGDDSLGGV